MGIMYLSLNSSVGDINTINTDKALIATLQDQVTKDQTNLNLAKRPISGKGKGGPAEIKRDVIDAAQTQLDTDKKRLENAKTQLKTDIINNYKENNKILHDVVYTTDYYIPSGDISFDSSKIPSSNLVAPIQEIQNSITQYQIKVKQDLEQLNQDNDDIKNLSNNNVPGRPSGKGLAIAQNKLTTHTKTLDADRIALFTVQFKLNREFIEITNDLRRLYFGIVHQSNATIKMVIDGHPTTFQNELQPSIDALKSRKADLDIKRSVLNGFTISGKFNDDLYYNALTNLMSAIDLLPTS